MIFKNKKDNEGLFVVIGCLVLIVVGIAVLYGCWELFLYVLEVIARTIKNA